MSLLLECEPFQGYFPEMSKSLFILDSLAHEEEAWREFEAEGLELKFVLGKQYLG